MQPPAECQARECAPALRKTSRSHPGGRAALSPPLAPVPPPREMRAPERKENAAGARHLMHVDVSFVVLIVT